MTHSAVPAAGWYPDPSDPARLRWWDGTAWTEHIHVIQQPVVQSAAEPAQQHLHVVDPQPMVATEPLVNDQDAVISGEHEAVSSEPAASYGPVSSKQSTGSTLRLKILVGLLIVAVVVVGGQFVKQRMQPDTPKTQPPSVQTPAPNPASQPTNPAATSGTPTPSSGTGQASTASPGSSVPASVNAATGNGVPKAQATAQKLESLQQEQDAAYSAAQ